MSFMGNNCHTILFSAMSLTLTAQTLKMSAATGNRMVRCNEAVILAGRFM